MNPKASTLLMVIAALYLSACDRSNSNISPAAAASATEKPQFDLKKVQTLARSYQPSIEPGRSQDDVMRVRTAEDLAVLYSVLDVASTPRGSLYDPGLVQQLRNEGKDRLVHFSEVCASWSPNGADAKKDARTNVVCGTVQALSTGEVK